jgi:hypothetical protein
MGKKGSASEKAGIKREAGTVEQTEKSSRAEKVFCRTTRKGEQNVSYICDLYPWVQSKPI